MDMISASGISTERYKNDQRNIDCGELAGNTKAHWIQKAMTISASMLF